MVLPRDARIAILGGTPEYRNMLGRIGRYNVVVFEKNTDFLNAQAPFCPHAHDETLIKGDWLETLPQHSRQFDLVLSHLTLGNIPYARQADFYSLVAKMLTPLGILSDVVLTHEAGLFEPVALLRGYRTAPINWSTVNDFNCRFVFCSELVAEVGSVLTDAAYDFALGGAGDPSISALVAMCKEITPAGHQWYYSGRSDQHSIAAKGSLREIARFDHLPSEAYYGNAYHILMRAL